MFMKSLFLWVSDPYTAHDSTTKPLVKRNEDSGRHQRLKKINLWMSCASKLYWDLWVKDVSSYTISIKLSFSNQSAENKVINILITLIIHKVIIQSESPILVKCRYLDTAQWNYRSRNARVLVQKLINTLIRTLEFKWTFMLINLREKIHI